MNYNSLNQSIFLFPQKTKIIRERSLSFRLRLILQRYYIYLHLRFKRRINLSESFLNMDVASFRIEAKGAVFDILTK